MVKKEENKFNVVFQFDTPEQALIFAKWYECGGEQSFDGGDKCNIISSAYVDIKKLDKIDNRYQFTLNNDNEVIVPLRIHKKE